MHSTDYKNTIVNFIYEKATRNVLIFLYNVLRPLTFTKLRQIHKKKKRKKKARTPVKTLFISTWVTLVEVCQGKPMC